jgi:PAS domain S-box-containing protein
MTEITDFNFAEDDFTAADFAKFELLKSEKVEVLNNLAELCNQIVAAKVAKLSQEKDEFYGKQLASKELESDTFYNHAPSGYFSTDGNGIIYKINATLLDWLGYSKEDIIGKVTWQSLLSVGGQMYFETHYSPLLQMQGFVQEISFEMVRKDRTRLPILINTKQIRDENGKVQINYSTVFDISQRKSYEKELLIAKRFAEEQNKLINEKNEKLLELLKRNLDLQQFSFIITHNLRAPLTNLIFICKLINPNKIEDPSTLKLIEFFKKSTYQLDETLNDLINVLNVKENTNLTLDELSFEEITDKVKESISESLSDNKAIIETDFSDMPTVHFAKVYLESIFLNLITNSIKYRHPERNLIVKIKTIKDAIGRSKLTFSDNGIGMDMSRVKHKIFGFHQRFHKNADSKGIGLILIKTQLNALGGEIEVDSEVNMGTIFTITFKEPIK